MVVLPGGALFASVVRQSPKRSSHSFSLARRPQAGNVATQVIRKRCSDPVSWQCASHPWSWGGKGGDQRCRSRGDLASWAAEWGGCGRKGDQESEGEVTGKK